MPFAQQLAEALAMPGRAAIVFADPAGDPERPVTLHAYRPANWQPDGQVVVVLHGMGRNGDEYRDFWIEAAERHQLLIVVPTFPAELFPGPECYNNGNVLAEDGSLAPAEWRGYRIPGRVVAALREAGLSTRPKVLIFGHSAGGQFLHRLLSTEPSDVFEAAMVGNPGWFSLPDLDRAFPEGLGGIGVSEAELARLLAFPMTILSGECDTETSGPSLPSQPEALAQGPHRFARALNYLERGREEAARRGLPFNWRRVTVPHIGHDGAAMSRVAASLWFEGRLPPDAVLAEWGGVGSGAL
ncbi:alpha/beta hydrolase [Roseomonas xinghualingensis]|uniref:alpha/beta hydrolase n=1 Tax=Roseomonas xinghualingensis TaxID=2986475 RepID=UPI0021F1662A|nr:alpha/beta hydrolase [Roseomonas sp. SXEYE001]MCV4208630.1 alpha/beta hydrolase [Roseomonas sp. SXEYE001]